MLKVIPNPPTEPATYLCMWEYRLGVMNETQPRCVTFRINDDESWKLYENSHGGWLSDFYPQELTPGSYYVNRIVSGRFNETGVNNVTYLCYEE